MSSPTNLQGVSCLPEELLFDITVYITEQQDLFSLSLASHQLRRIANEKLYTHPVLDEPYSHRYHHTVEKVFSFGLALLRRPEVASRVRTLSISLLRQQAKSSPTWSSGDMAKALQTIEAMGTKGPCWTARVADWKARLLRSDGKACGGLILALLPNLVKLDIEILATCPSKGWTHDEERIWSCKRYAIRPLDKLFGVPKRCPDGNHRIPLELSQVCGLGRLETLRFFGDHLDTNWCTLPKLQCLEVAQGCDYPRLSKPGAVGSPSSFVSPAVDTLHFELATCLTNRFDYHNAFYPRSLSCASFPCLENLYITLTNVVSWQLPSGYAMNMLSRPRQGNPDMLISHLALMSADLKTLSLDTYDGLDPGFLVCLQPITTLTAFKKLQVLTVPHDLLLFRNGPDPIALLPAHLQALNLLYPTVDVFVWLDRLNKPDGAFSHLNAVHLFCGHLRGDSYLAMSKKHQAWVRYRKLHYHVTVHPTSRNAQYDMQSGLTIIPHDADPRNGPIVCSSAVAKTVPPLNDEKAFPPLASLNLNK